MAYVVLARKYRPQRFADLIGEEHVTRTLANAIANDRVHHAYLFCGGRGLGKTTTARLLAKCLVCVHGPTAEPCNECSECVAVTEGRSVDVIEIDGASNNRVDDVRNLRDQVRYLPQSARRKIYIIDEVHMLTGSAFNALLKTLEEPPEHVTFIFATTEVHELPATILSRVSRFDFRRLPSARLVEHMKSILANEGVEVEDAGLYLVARAGDGSVRDSLTLLDKVIAFASDTAKISAEEVRVVLGVPSQLAVASLASAVLARDAEATLRQLDEVVASGQDLQQLALAFLQHLRNLVVIKLTTSRDVLIDASEAEFDHLRGEAERVEVSVLCQLFDRFARVVDSLANTRVPRLLLEMGLLDLVHAEPLIPLGGLIDRLEEISRGAPGLSGLPRGSAREISSGRPAAPSAAQGSAPPAGRRESAPAASARQAPPAAAPRPAPQPPQPPPRPVRGAPGGPGAGGATSDFLKIVQASGVLSEGGFAGGDDLAEPPEEPERRSPPRSSPPPGASASPPPAGRSPTGSSEPPPLWPDEIQASEAAEEAACATGACPGAPRAAPAEVIEWASMPPFEAWELLLGRIGEEEPALHGILADMGLESFGGGEIRVVFPGDRLRYRKEQLEHHSAAFEELAHLHLGAPFRLTAVEGDPDLETRPSLTLAVERRRQEIQNAADEEARAHPSIRALIDAFDAQIVTVRPLARPS